MISATGDVGRGRFLPVAAGRSACLGREIWPDSVSRSNVVYVGCDESRHWQPAFNHDDLLTIANRQQPVAQARSKLAHLDDRNRSTN
jgi:hypothetical protein